MFLSRVKRNASEWSDKSKSVREFSTGCRVSRHNASLYPFFDLQKVCIKAVKANSPFIVQIPLEQVQYGKTLIPMGHPWQLKPSVLNRKQIQGAFAFFP